MRRDEVVAALEAALACETFNSREGRGIESRGFEALRAVPRGVDEGLVRRAYARYLDEAPYYAWRCVHKVGREHAAGLLAELEAARPSLQRTLLLAAAGEPSAELSDAGFERLVRAGTLLAKINSFDHAATSRSMADRIRAYSTEPVLISAAQTALRTFPLGKHEGRSATLEHLWLLTLLAQDGGPESLATLGAVVQSTLAQRSEQAEVYASSKRALARLMGYYISEHPALADLVAQVQQSEAG